VIISFLTSIFCLCKNDEKTFVIKGVEGLTTVAAWYTMSMITAYLPDGQLWEAGANPALPRNCNR
jgi:hypothetical protein